jgi:hypothetical protein
VPGAGCPKNRRQRVGSPLEFVVGDGPVVADQRRPLGAGERALAEQCVDRRVAWIWGIRLTPLLKQHLTLAVQQEVKLGGACLRGPPNCRHQRLKAHHEPCDRRLIEQVAAVLEVAADVLRGLPQHEVQVEFRLGPGRHRRRRGGAVEPEQLDGHVDQRGSAGAAVGRQRLDEEFEWQLGMGVRSQRAGPYAVEQLDERRVAVQPAAQNERIDEEAEQALEFGPVAVGDRDAKAKVALAAQTPQQCGECGNDGHEQTRASAWRKRAQSGGLLGTEHDRVQPGAPGWSPAARVRGRQLQRR